jgi:uncharacterized membrane protein
MSKEAIESINSAIKSIQDECEAQRAVLFAAAEGKIEALRAALTALGGKLNGSRPRPKPSRAASPKRTRVVRTVDPALAENRTKILALFEAARGGGRSLKDIVAETEIPKPKATMILRQLIETGAILVEGKGRGTCYRMHPAAESAAQ